MCRAENSRPLAPDKNWNFDFLARICHVGDDQRSVRLNNKKKSTNTSPYPDEVIDRLARAFYPAILTCWNSEEGQREFAAWQAEQAHHATSKEKQSVPDGERPVVHIVIVCGFWQGVSYSGAHPVFVLPLIF